LVNLQQTEQLVLKLDESRRENECINDKLMNVEGRCKKLEGEMFNSNEEKEKLIAIVNQKKVELEDLVGRVEKGDRRITELQGIEQEFKALKVLFCDMQINCDKLEQKCKDIEGRYSK